MKCVELVGRMAECIASSTIWAGALREAAASIEQPAALISTVRTFGSCTVRKSLSFRSAQESEGIGDVQGEIVTATSAASIVDKPRSKFADPTRGVADGR
eukprot:4443089-Prymnesium_polylepis.1